MNLKKWAAACVFLTTAAWGNGVFDATIPVLDMNDYFDPAGHEQFVSELHAALKDVGFFAVVNTGVDVEILDAAYARAKEFFELPFDEKLGAFAPSSNCQRGYVPTESPKGQNACDCKEFYHVGRELTAEQQERLGYWENVWSDKIDLKEPLCNLFAALGTYMVPLQEAMAEAIGERKDFFCEMTEEGDVLLRAIHYPANPPENLLWAGEHTDIDLFTILPRATADGLQLLNREGDWISIKVPENAFIVNCGDMMENITNGEFHSGLHRVKAEEENVERYSMVIFIHPRRDDRLDPLPGCVARTGGVRNYANATRIELLEERLVDLGLASEAMMKDLAESGLMERLIEVRRASPKAMKKLAEAGLASPAVLAELQKTR